jgi:hypothetical protein
MKTYPGTNVDPMISVLKDMCRYKKAHMAKGNYKFTTKVKPEVVEVLSEAA